MISTCYAVFIMMTRSLILILHDGSLMTVIVPFSLADAQDMPRTRKQEISDTSSKTDGQE